MEQLLNKLIEKGWKPFNVDCAWTNVEVINKINNNRYIPEHSKIIFKTDTHRHVFDCDIRDLVSKSSGLWQFVCKNGMVKKMKKINKGIWIDSWHKDAYESYPVYTMEKYEYWILESALKDESELEEFLLDDIKIDE